MKAKTIYDFIKVHLGNIDFTGDHSSDMEHINNMDNYEELILMLLEDIENVHYNCDERPEKSAQMLKEKTETISKNINEFLVDSGMIE